MAYCKFCGDTGKWKTLSGGKKHFFHQNHDCADYIARKLAPKHRQLTVQSFTRPTRCDICGGECFYYENEHGSKVFFDELGPPWPKHDHDACIKRQEKRPKPPWQWELAGYEPCVIYKTIPVVHLQRFVVYVRRLISGQNLALCVGARDIKSFINRLHQPFLLKAVTPAIWELNTYAQFDNRFEARPYRCREAQCAWPIPPDPSIPWFEKNFPMN
jgi:hypothetical protein